MATKTYEGQVDCGRTNYNIIQIIPINAKKKPVEHIIEWIEIQSRWSFLVSVVKMWELCMRSIYVCCCIWNKNSL